MTAPRRLKAGARAGDEEGGWTGAGESSGLGPDKRTGTFWSHVVDGVEHLPEPDKERRFLFEQNLSIYQRLVRDLLVGAAS